MRKVIIGQLLTSLEFIFLVLNTENVRLEGHFNLSLALECIITNANNYIYQIAYEIRGITK